MVQCFSVAKQFIRKADVAELADASDSKSDDGNIVRVQVSSSA